MKFSKEKYIGLGHVPIGIGAVIKGWNVTEKYFRNLNLLPVIDFFAMTNACPHNCFHCFTEKNKKTLTLDEIKKVIDQLAEMKTAAINFDGEGEPTIDKDFFEIIEYATKKGIQPIVFTDAATKCRDRSFVRRIKNLVLVLFLNVIVCGIKIFKIGSLVTKQELILTKEMKQSKF